MRILLFLLTTAVCLSLQGCGFLDDELLTEDSLFGVGGMGLSGTSRSGCGGGFSSRRVTRSSRSADKAADFDEVELHEFEMDVMNFQSARADHQTQLNLQRVEAYQNDPWVDVFVQAENQVDSVSFTAQREGVH